MKTLQNCHDLWHPDLIAKYDLSGPRYTSYPTAVQFNDGVDNSLWQHELAKGNNASAPLSLYFHIPFCETVCYYCGCNKIITANKKRATAYLDYLHQEVRFQAQHINHDRVVTQLHWGGGTPTYISDAEMTQLMNVTRENFNLLDDDTGEYSIEIHPTSVDKDRIKLLRDIGFNRISMGIQDFDPDVQKAVNRFNSEEEVTELVAAIREHKFHSLSMDLIYGLPLQTAESFAKTLEKVIELNPDRLSVFNYAHMPHLFKVQKQIDATQLPEPQEKLQILHNTIERLLEAGYEYIGMDHFAKPDDELAIAQKNGSLHRNFQGYATQSECDLLAFGVSSISSIGNSIIQNHKNIEEYTQAIQSENLPFARSIILHEEDNLRKAVINELICNFKLSYADVEQNYSIDFKEHFSDALARLQEMAEDKLITLDESGITVHPSGRLLIRRICMEFDEYIDHAKLTKNKFSRII